MPNFIPDCSMDDDENMSHASYPSAASSVRSGPAAYGSNYHPPQFSAHYRGGGASHTSEGELSLKRDREREGRCSECGVQTHEFRLDPVTGRHVKMPLTMEGEVHRGRCLLCYPIPPSRGPPITCGRSQRSIATISTLGNNSAPGTYPYQQNAYPDQVESVGAGGASTVTNSSVIDETLQSIEDESSDLLDILTAMRRFENDRRIQEKGLEKLWIQSWDDENSAAIGRVGGIATILHAMRKYLESPHVQQYSCEALQNLALNEYNRDVICENGGITAVVQAMNQHNSVVGVQQAGCTALANIAASRDQHMDIANAGGLHAIVRAAQAFSDEEHVLRSAYQALRALGYDPQRHGPQAVQQPQGPRAVQQPQAEREQSNTASPIQEGSEEDDMQEETPQQQQGQQQPPPQQQGSGQERNVIRLDAYGFPINN